MTDLYAEFRNPAVTARTAEEAHPLKVRLNKTVKLRFRQLHSEQLVLHDGATLIHEAQRRAAQDHLHPDTTRDVIEDCIALALVRRVIRKDFDPMLVLRDSLTKSKLQGMKRLPPLDAKQTSHQKLLDTIAALKKSLQERRDAEQDLVQHHQDKPPVKLVRPNSASFRR